MTAAVQSKKYALRGVIRHVYKQMGRALTDYTMLRDGDKVLVAVSGGRDSLSLLKLFQMKQKRIPVQFELIVCFVETNFIKVDTAAVKAYLDSCGVRMVIRRIRLEKEADRTCFWCSWNRRKELFTAAREQGCNLVALGHNLDDIAETVLMNLLFKGEISTSPPQLSMFDGEIRLIRPLCYLSKQEIEQFAAQFDFPDTHYECPYGKDSKRVFVKRILRELEQECPFVKKNVFRALGRIKTEYLV
ncbi:MAG: hypothetical protein GF333_00100 [Candidatus Omnitrophica bacterium]|nr:hypothetical protein [Candidatus Omnitrophota bacterium]